MSGLIVNIKRLHPHAVIPRYETELAAGFDLVAVEDVIIAPGETAKIPLGLAFEIPDGYVMIICMRSGIALNTKLRQPNGIGVIDADYRGEVAMMFDNISKPPRKFFLRHPPHWNIGANREGTYIIRKGDRIAQGVIAPVERVTFAVVDELSETVRGSGGFGHTGVNAQ